MFTAGPHKAACSNVIRDNNTSIAIHGNFARVTKAAIGPLIDSHIRYLRHANVRFLKHEGILPLYGKPKRYKHKRIENGTSALRKKDMLATASATPATRCVSCP